MKRGFAILLIFVSLWGKSQYGGLPEWPFVVGAKDYLHALDNLPSSNIANYTPHAVLKWDNNQSGSIKEIDGTAPISGPDNVSITQAAFNGCGEFAFYALHTGVKTDINGLELYSGKGELLLGKNTNPPAPNSNYFDEEVQMVRRPGYSNQWFIIYSNQNSDPYKCQQVFYSLVELQCQAMKYVTLNNVVQKDILLTAPVIGGNQNSPMAGRFYIHGKAVSRTSKTGGVNNHDLYLHRRYDSGVPARVSQSTFSIDRFEISSTGINWKANSGLIPSYSWSLLGAGSPMELSPTENKLAVMARTDVPNTESIYVFDLNATNGIGNGPGEYQTIKLDELLVVPDKTNESIVNYSADINDLSTYQSVKNLATTSPYLQFLKNMDRKISGCEFSFDGNSLYISAGGYVKSAYGNLSYLGQINLTTSHQGKHPVRLQIEEVDGWRQNDGRQTNWWGQWSTNLTHQDYFMDYTGVYTLQSSINGNLYFTKARTDTLFSIPDPNSPLPVKLIPHSIDLSNAGNPNLKFNGLAFFIPDQIDGYDYSSSDFTKLKIPVQYQKLITCSLECDTLMVSIVNKQGEEICSDSILSCPDTLELCLSNSQTYDLVGDNGITFNDAIVNGVLNFPDNATVFDFSTDIAGNDACCPKINLGRDTSFCTNNFSLDLDASTKDATYKWQDGSTNSSYTITGEGVYWVIVTANNCSDTDSISVNRSSSIDFTLGQDQIVCPGEFFTFKAPISGNYNWNNGLSNKDSLVTNTVGEIILEISDENGCTGSDTVNLFNNNPLTIDLGSNKKGCLGQDIVLGLNPAREGLTYAWSIGGTNISSDSSIIANTLGTISYLLTVDSGACSASSSIDVSIYPPPALSLINDTFICQGSGQNILLDAGPGFANYLWSTGNTNQSLSVTTQGTYYVDITDANGCKASDTTSVQLATPSQITLTADKTQICSLDSAIVSMDPASANANNASWIWKNNGATDPLSTYAVKNRADGENVKVILEYTNEFGCLTTVESEVITVSNQLAITPLKDTNACEGTNLVLAAETSPNYTYSWTNSEGIISTGNPYITNPLSTKNTGLISLAITDTVFGCTGSTSAQIDVFPAPQPVLSSAVICLGTNHLLDPKIPIENHRFEWTENQTIMDQVNSSTLLITGNSTGLIQYGVTVTNTVSGCAKDTSVILSIKGSGPFKMIDLTPEIICEGNTKELTTLLDTSLYAHTWSVSGTMLAEQNNTLSVTSSGDYTVEVIEKTSSCSQSASTSISYLPQPTVNFNLGNPVNLCMGNDTVLIYDGYDPSKTYQWSTGATQTDRITIDQPGIYWLKELVGTCSDSDGVVVIPRELPSSDLNNDTILCFENLIGGQLKLDTKQARSDHSWSTGELSQSILVNEPGLYTVNITSQHGCFITDSMLIEEDCLPNLYIPNAFSPNKDGRNDTWGAITRGINSVALWVFDRWGELIWTGNNIGDRWDGTYKRNPVAQDVYVWKVSYSYRKQNKEKKQTRVGIVTIIR